MKTGNNILPILFIIAFCTTFSEWFLSPFYPQYFLKVFNVDDPVYVGSFYSIGRIALMSGLLIWGWVSRYLPIFKILIATQSLSAALNLLACYVTDPDFYFGISVAIIFLKTSNLLLLPTILNYSEDKNKTISYLKGFTHLAVILSTYTGGYLLGQVNPVLLMLLLGIADLLQLGFCIWLQSKISAVSKKEKHSGYQFSLLMNPQFIYLILLVFLFYFLTNLLRPFYSSHLLAISGKALDLDVVAAIFSIPSFMAIIFSTFIKRYTERKLLGRFFMVAAAMVFAGLIFQGLPQITLHIFGRLFYGMAIFYIYLCLDIILINIFEPQFHTAAFSLVFTVQNIAMTTAPVAAGLIVDNADTTAIFSSSAMVCMLFFAASFNFLKVYGYFKKEIRVLVD